MTSLDSKDTNCSQTKLSVQLTFSDKIIFSRAVQAERLIWSLWCLYVCRDVVLLDNFVRQLSNRKINHILTYTKEFFLTADLA